MGVTVGIVMGVAALLQAVPPAGDWQRELATVEWRLESAAGTPEAPSTLYAGQRFELSAHFELAAELLEPGRLGPMPRDLELDVELRTPLAEGLPAGLAWVERVAAPDATSVVIAVDGARTPAEARPDSGDSKVGGPRVPHDVRYRVQLEPDFSGTLRIDALELRLNRVTATGTDLFGQPRPADAESLRVRSEPLVLEVLQPPPDDRPLGWTGAVGEFEVRSVLAEPVVFEGEPLRLELRFTGSGNFGDFDPPLAEAFPGLHLLGWTRAATDGDETDGSARDGGETITYELLAPGPGECELPALEVVFWRPDGAQPGFEVRSSDPVRARVLPRQAADRPEAPATAQPARRAPRWIWPLAGAAAALLVLALRRRRRAR